MKLDVIFDKARPDIPSVSATLNEGKYLPDFREFTIEVNLSFSALSEGKNWTCSYINQGVKIIRGIVYEPRE